MTLSPTPDYSDYVPDPEDMRNYYVTGRLGWDESHLRTDPKVRKVMDAFDAGIAQVKADAVAEYKAQGVSAEEVEVALAAWFRAEHKDLCPADPDDRVDRVVAVQMNSVKTGTRRVRLAIRAALEAARGAR